MQIRTYFLPRIKMLIQSKVIVKINEKKYKNMHKNPSTYFKVVKLLNF